MSSLEANLIPATNSGGIEDVGDNNDEIADTNNKILISSKKSLQKQLEEVIREKEIYKLKNSGNKNSDPKAPNNNTKTGETQGEYLDGRAGIKEDSILNDIIQERLSRNEHVAKVHNFQGTTVDNMKYHVIALFRKEPSFIIIYPGTNDAP